MAYEKSNKFVNIGFLNGYGLIKRGFKSRFGWRPWEPS